MADKLTYNEKSNPVPVVNRDLQVTAEDFNDIKTVVNANADEANLKLKVFTFEFDNTDLINGVLEVEHILNTAFPKLTLKRPDNTFEETTQIMKYVDVNNVNLDFGGAIEDGTWSGLITYQ